MVFQASRLKFFPRIPPALQASSLYSSLPWQCPPGGNLNPQYPGTHSSHCRPNTLSLQLHWPRMISVLLISLLQLPSSVIPTEKQSQAEMRKKQLVRPDLTDRAGTPTLRRLFTLVVPPER